MKYFIDTEFIEGFKKPLFGKKRHFIDLISIGIKAEDGREYYAISNEFNPNDADQWVKDNVISNLFDEDGMYFVKPKSNKQIAEEIKDFVGAPNYYPINSVMRNSDTTQPHFYAYYADYDWVVFCSLFGRMVDLPKGFPMYCRDLKQMIDEQASFNCRNSEESNRFEVALQKIKDNENYPKQENEHSALDDAKWNFELYKFLKTL